MFYHALLMVSILIRLPLFPIISHHYCICLPSKPILSLKNSILNTKLSANVFSVFALTTQFQPLQDRCESRFLLERSHMHPHTEHVHYVPMCLPLISRKLSGWQGRSVPFIELSFCLHLEFLPNDLGQVTYSFFFLMCKMLVKLLAGGWDLGN